MVKVAQVGQGMKEEALSLALCTVRWTHWTGTSLQRLATLCFFLLLREVWPLHFKDSKCCSSEESEPGVDDALHILPSGCGLVRLKFRELLMLPE